LRGSSSKETNPIFILGMSARLNDVYAPRYLEVRKQKNGRQGVCVDFRMEDYRITVPRAGMDGEVEETVVDTLVIKWEGELRSVDQPRAADDDPTPAQHKMLTALRELMRTKSLDGKVVASKDWQDKCLADKICASASAFKFQKSAMKGKFIGVSESGDSVWIMIG